MAPSLIEGPDGLSRCWWCGSHEDYRAYHDDEWGRPELGDARLFEKLCLEGFQSGLSWLTILRKRENFRRAFREFEIDRVARFNERSVARLLGDAGIVRHEGKIRSAINNARCAQALREEAGSLGAFFWQFRQDGPFSGVPATTETSKQLAKDLKSRGWTYVGPTTVYAFMQAMGLVNDHLPGCATRPEVERLRSQVQIPT
tara:strand:- start:232 stop:834 length:603 start_codon:yes stop_codon:yes gene_type:complete